MKNLIDEIGKANLTDTFNSSVGSLDRFCNRSAIDVMLMEIISLSFA